MRAAWLLLLLLAPLLAQAASAGPLPASQCGPVLVRRVCVDADSDARPECSWVDAARVACAVVGASSARASAGDLVPRVAVANCPPGALSLVARHELRWTMTYTSWDGVRTVRGTESESLAARASWDGLEDCGAAVSRDASLGLFHFGVACAGCALLTVEVDVLARVDATASPIADGSLVDYSEDAHESARGCRLATDQPTSCA